MRIEEIELESESANGRVPCVVAFPDGKAPLEGWPFLTCLHGLGRSRRTLADAKEFACCFEKRSFAVLCPEGGASWYLDSPVDKTKRGQSAILEALGSARKRLPLSKRRELCGIAGWSMGGYGAIRLAQRSPQSFSFAASIIGLLDFPKEGDELLPIGIPKLFGENPELWRKLSCMAGTEKLRGIETLILAGRSAWDFPMSLKFREKLLELGVDCRYEELAGGHEWPTVAEALPLLFEAAERHFRTKRGMGLPSEIH